MPILFRQLCSGRFLLPSWKLLLWGCNSGNMLSHKYVFLIATYCLCNCLRFSRDSFHLSTRQPKLMRLQDNDCTANLTAAPACANSTWSLFKTGSAGGSRKRAGLNDLFCCDSGQIGLDTGPLCVPSSAATISSIAAELAITVSSFSKRLGYQGVEIPISNSAC